MKKTILMLVLILSLTSLKAQNLFNAFTHDTILLQKNVSVDKVDLYDRAKSFFKSHKKDNEIINLNSLPLYKNELDASPYYKALTENSGYLNATFVDENNKRFNIGVSCYKSKYIYYVTSDEGVNKLSIKTKIDELKQAMLTSVTIIFTPVNTTQSQLDTNQLNTTHKVDCTPRQCSGTTQKGTRCKRMTTNCNGRCYQH